MDNSCNPLRQGGAPGEDTLNNVRDVLAFMADACYVQAASTAGIPISEAGLRGLGHILAVCADALREADQ